MDDHPQFREEIAALLATQPAAAAATTMPPSPIASGAATDAAPVGNIVAMIRAVESFNVNGAAC